MFGQRYLVCLITGNKNCAGLEVLTSLSTKSKVFRDVTPYSVIEDYQLLGGTYCIHLQSWRVSEAVNQSSAWF
jgi:hypothetical protein